MAGKESNPIQQRMELLVEKWEAAAAKAGVSIIRMHALENEKDMVDAFSAYLLGVDTSNHDIPVIFESIYHNDHQYTQSVLDELKELISIWNNANKDSLAIHTEPINWEPDYSLSKHDNPAYPFIENMNRLAGYLGLGKNVYLVAILKVSFVDPDQFSRWIEFALKAGITDKFKILVDDTIENPFYDRIARKYPVAITTLRPELDMDNAMQQVAAMGNPNDAGVQYRKSFIALTQAIGKREEALAQKHGATCIEIAMNNLEKSPYWIGQVIAVNAALANDQVGYKNFKKAIMYATEGVQAAERSRALIKDEFVYRKFMGQAVMLRGSLYTASKNMSMAVEDFTVAAASYVATNDIILAMEAYRMMGFCHKASGNTDAACKALAEAVKASTQVPPHIARVTTFAGIIEMLFEINNAKYISHEEVQEAAEQVYGRDWVREVRNWKSPHYTPVNDPSKIVTA
jgi:tetratricopeptide (TPR) repeat protein